MIEVNSVIAQTEFVHYYVRLADGVISELYRKWIIMTHLC